MGRASRDCDVSAGCPQVSSDCEAAAEPPATVTSASARDGEVIRVDVPAGSPVLTPGAARALLALLRRLHQTCERAG